MEPFLLILISLMVKKRKPVSQRTIYRKRRLPSINKFYKTNAKRLKSTIFSDDHVEVGTNTSDMETSGNETELRDSFSPVPSFLKHSSEHSTQHTYRAGSNETCETSVGSQECAVDICDNTESVYTGVSFICSGPIKKKQKREVSS